MGATVEQLRTVIDEYAAAGVHNVLALRGILGGPTMAWTATEGGLNYAAELVTLVRDSGDFSVWASPAFPDLHPASKSADLDVQVLLAKQDAGAEFAVTQLFFKSQSYFDLVERAVSAGVEIPILPGNHACHQPLSRSLSLCRTVGCGLPGGSRGRVCNG